MKKFWPLGLCSLFCNREIVNLDDSKSWSIEAVRKFLVKFLWAALAASPVSKALFSPLWKSNCPKKIDILMWIMINSSLNTTNVMQRKLSSFLLCGSSSESLNHSLFNCSMLSLAGNIFLEVSTFLGFL